MKFLTGLFFCFLLTFSSLYAQSKTEHKTKKYTVPCRDAANYIPYDYAQFPVKRLRLVYHIIQKDDGTGNLQDLPKYNFFLQLIINHLNGMYMDPEVLKPAPENYKYIEDTRIRWVVDTIFYHRSTEDWDFKKVAVVVKPGTHDSTWNDARAFSGIEKLYKKYVTNNTDLKPYQRDSALHVFMIEAGKFGGRGMAHGIYSKKWFFMAGTYETYKKDTIHPDHWDAAMLMGHELGHNLGLTHPREYHYCDDLPVSKKGSTNNLMDTYPNEGSGLSPCQIGQIHLGLSGFAGDVSDIVIPDWCNYHPDSVVYVNSGDTVDWKGSRWLLGDIQVERNTVLRITCTVTIPPHAHVTIMPGATLFLDGGEIVNGCNGEQQEVIIKTGKRYLLFGKKKTGKIITKEL